MNHDMTTSEGSPRRFLSIAEAAAELGLSEMTLYRLIQANSFPAVRVGRRVFIPSKALDDMHAEALATGRVVDAAEWQSSQVAG
ncbi:helix-turn-helix domain-containing protein [Kribbella sp. NPDC002412]